MIIKVKFVVTLGLFLLILSNTPSVNAHQGQTHKAPWQSCEGAQKEDKCSYTNHSGDLYKGSCQLFSEALMCVRNEPIIYANKPSAEDRSTINSKIQEHDSK
jgi:hypothetical protein